MKQLTKQTLSIYWKATKPYFWPGVGLILFLLVAIAVDLLQPLAYRGLFNSLADSNAPISEATRYVYYIFGLGLGTFIAWRVITTIVDVYFDEIRIVLLNHAYKYTTNHSIAFFANSFVGSLVSKITRFERAYVRMVDEIVYGIGKTFVVLIATLVILAYKIPVASIIMAIWIVVYLVIMYKVSRYKVKFDLEASKQESATTAHIADTVTNNMNLKLFTAENYEYRKFTEITKKLYYDRLKPRIISNVIEGAQGLLMSILEFVILLIALRLWQQGQLTIGDFALLQGYLLTIFHHMWGIGRNIRNLYESTADANEMTDVLLTEHEVIDNSDAKKLKVKSGAIQFKNVGFEYKEGVKVLNNFELSILAGEKVALVGPSGGGKTTIVKLLMRFYDVTKGQILIDGQDSALVTQESLRKQISLVPQDPILFHRSLLENIRYGNSRATEKEVIAAAKAAHCHEFISKLADGYETLVGERGVKLSGGERQRVAIARAILKNAPILVLDEATSSLDSESEILIQDALKVLMKGKTTIVIAHRLSTIMSMDRIVVIEKGRVSEEGKHEELLKAKQGKYQKLWNIQAGGFN
ncbi:ABC transporter ATP-binding protein [bacterium]|nr:MAG: ABC transporter ATP-binding protein [bacterium]